MSSPTRYEYLRMELIEPCLDVVQRPRLPYHDTLPQLVYAKPRQSRLLQLGL